MFEYMASGLAVIASDIPLWKEIIESKCGVCVNPLNSKDIADAVGEMIQNPEALKEMGTNGKAVVQKYNWSNEEEKLLMLYRTILA